MLYHLVSGGAGFVGRHVVKHILRTTDDAVVLVDDLSTGLHPKHWLGEDVHKQVKELQVLGKDGRVYFWQGDFRTFLRNLTSKPGFLPETYDVDITAFADVFHFAAIVGGRAKIEGDPMAVALDLAIDAEFFYWVCRHKPRRVLYPSSSAAYPVHLQQPEKHTALKENDIDLDASMLGRPDMTYGWSKLTGEYLARIAAQHYGISVACVRPFSGYGEDQDLTYPIPALAARAARREDPFEVWGSGKQGRDFVHIDDCIDCIMLALDKIHDGSAVNIGSGRLTTFLEIIEIFCSFAGYRPQVKPLLEKPVGVHARYA
ncbi:MAG: NAD-dependent epimerase/dehydratase family protein, partial [Calditrichaeota bacterium]